MLKRLRRWLGWDAESGPFDFGNLDIPPRVARPKAASAPVGKSSPPGTPPSTARPGTASTAKTPRTEVLDSPRVLDLLDNPQLTLDRPNDVDDSGDGFDPYNTGAFNRGASWEKISRHKR